MVRGEAKLFIGQISYDATKESLWRLFAAYGDVVDVQVLYDKERHVSRGAAFVTFGSTEEADTAIAALHDRYRMLPNRFIQVSYAKNSPNISPYGHHIAVDVATRNQSNPMPGAVPTRGSGTPPPPPPPHPMHNNSTNSTANMQPQSAQQHQGPYTSYGNGTRPPYA